VAGTGEKHAFSFGMHAERLPGHLTGHIERRPRRSLPRFFQGIRRDPFFQGLQHGRRGLEEPIRRREPLEPLVRTLEVVVVDE
jgi:hypothetical protein